MKKKKDLREEIVDVLEGKKIKSIGEAIKFLEEDDGAVWVKDVDWKWEVKFESDEPFKFYSDEELIDWCNEQKEQIEECKNER